MDFLVNNPFTQGLVFLINLVFQQSYHPIQANILIFTQLFSSTIAVITGLLFFAYYIVKIILQDCGLAKQCKKIGLLKGVNTRMPFFTQQNRFLLYMEIGCFLEATFNWVDFISRYSNCNITGMLTMFADFWALTWGFNIALFFFIEVIFRPKSCSSLYCKMEWIEEIFTESCACSIFAVITLFFTIFPLIFGLYGKSGSHWCWVDAKQEFLGIKGIWLLLLYYFELWIVYIFILFFYFVLIVKSCCVFAKLRALETSNMGKMRKESKNMAKYVTSLMQDTTASLLGSGTKYKKQQVHKEIRTFWKLAFFPLFFVLVWAFPSANRLIFVLTQRNVYLFSLIHTFTFPMNGTLNFFFVVFDPYKCFSRMCLCLCLPCRGCCWLLKDQKKSRKSSKKGSKSLKEDLGADLSMKEIDRAFMMGAGDSDEEDQINAALEEEEGGRVNQSLVMSATEASAGDFMLPNQGPAVVTHNFAAGQTEYMQFEAALSKTTSSAAARQTNRSGIYTNPNFNNTTSSSESTSSNSGVPIGIAGKGNQSVVGNSAEYAAQTTTSTTTSSSQPQNNVLQAPSSSLGGMGKLSGLLATMEKNVEPCPTPNNDDDDSDDEGNEQSNNYPNMMGNMSIPSMQMGGGNEDYDEDDLNSEREMQFQTIQQNTTE